MFIKSDLSTMRNLSIKPPGSLFFQPLLVGEGGGEAASQREGLIRGRLI